MSGQDIQIPYNDTTIPGYMAEPADGQKPGVVVVGAIFGVDDDVKAITDRLAANGYPAVAPNMFWEDPDGNTGIIEVTPEGSEQGRARAGRVDRDAGVAYIAAAIEVLRQQPEVDAARVAAMGFCFGGLCVLDLARAGSDVRGVISFHGMFGAPGNTAGTPIQASVLCLHGYDDPMAQPDALLALASELTAAGADWQVHAYGNTVHAFTNPAADNPDMGTVYSAVADRRSWSALLDFLEEIFSAG